MKVLVTGGTGFTGKALVKRLIDGGHQVVAMDYKEGIKTDEIKGWGAEVVIGSVTDTAVVNRVVKGVDVVHHLAAAFRELDVPNNYYEEVNIQGTVNVLEAAKQEGVKRFIYCSTCGVHGNVENPPAAETAPIKPADYYQRTKYEAEPLVLAEHGATMQTLVVRPAAIYGPGDPERFGMIFRRVNKGVFPIFGDGKALYHPLFIDNFVDLLEIVLKPGMGDGEVYLVADEEYVEIEQLVKRVAKAMGKEVKLPHYPFLPLSIAGHVMEKLCQPFKVTPPIFPRRVDWYRQNRAFDISKAKKDLGYKPQVGLDEGLRLTAEWYVAEGYL
ncbi:MAG: NAD(P)-dependent oxidoreductase [Arenicellales bacterium]|nr:NAD(P)-dependent oxidoreductase [Arenicellales bacterium]